MSGSGAQKRSQNLAIRCADLRDQGVPLAEIARLVGVDKEKIPARIELGQRLRTVACADTH